MKILIFVHHIYQELVIQFPSNSQTLSFVIEKMKVENVSKSLTR